MSVTAENQEQEDALSILKAKAQELGIDADELQRPEFADFIEGKGYHLRIVEARNTTSSKGAEQVELSLMALDEDGEPVKYARSKMWLTYPFDSEAFKFPTREAKQRAQEEMAALIRATGDAAYQSARKVIDATGGRAHYFDADNKELIGKARGYHEKLVFMRIIEEVRRRQKEDVEGWVGTEFYAQRRHSEYNGQTYRSWSRISVEPRRDVAEYILEGHRMLAPGGKEDAAEEAHDAPF